MGSEVPEDWRGAVTAHKARYRDRIIDAAVDLAAERGLAGVSMAGLAQRAGIGRATLYKYFPDVEHVLVAHVEREMDRYTERLRTALEAQDDPLERLRTYIDTLFTYFAGQGGAAGAPLEPAGLSPVFAETLERHRAKVLDPLETTLAAGIRAGALRADFDPHLHARMILELLGALAGDLTSGRLTADEGVEIVWSLLTHGLLAAGT